MTSLTVIVLWQDGLPVLYEGGRPGVRERTLEISEMFVSYSISPKLIKLSFEIE